MKNAQKPDHISLNTLISRLKEGRFVIPDFQRDFEWGPWDIRDLIRSIFLDYYIGSLLLWKGKSDNFKALSCEHVRGFEGIQNAPYESCGEPEHIVLDGQQRLTALYYALFMPEIPLPKRANRAVYFVRIDRFMAEEYDGAFHYEWLNKKYKKILANPELQYAGHIFPLSILSAGGRATLLWIQGYEAYWKTKVEVAEESGKENAAQIGRMHIENGSQFDSFVEELTGQYQISFVELDRDIGLDKVCDIFTQINSKGVALDVFDLINAMLKPRHIQLKHMWREASRKLEFVESGKMNVYVLQVMSILCQAYCSPKYLYFLLPGQEKPVRDHDGTRRDEILIPDKVDFTKRWNEAVDALEDAVEHLQHPQEFGVISSKYIPYVSILPAFAALQAAAKKCPSEIRLSAQRKIRHWYWASIFLNRYSGSVASTSARDFIAMTKWYEDENAEPELIFEFKHRFRNIDLRREIRRGSSIYNGIFNLLIIQGARDWITGNVAKKGDLDDHHIVPQSWGQAHLKKGAVDTILNRTPLTADTNRAVINDRLPNEYLPEWISKNGEDSVRATLESHFISPLAFDILLRPKFSVEDYDAFIAERNRTIVAAMEALLIKERLDLAANLRSLDADIELVELSIRSKVAVLLKNEWERIPEHVKQKVDARISSTARKNAAFDLDRYQSLIAKLEFFDLRELQDVITSKVIWPDFQTMFGAKEALITKFDQLAELRNSIRHSRVADEITTKEGEAAILWFTRICSPPTTQT